jgi:hypothetical protein
MVYEGKLNKITADFSTETLKARRAWSEVFQALEENYFSPRILYPAKLSFKIEGQIPRWQLEGGSRKCVSYSEILERC